MKTIQCPHCKLTSKIPDGPAVHTIEDCTLTGLALWMASNPGRSVIDIHPYERIWMVSLQDRGGEPYQAHGQGANLHEAVAAAVADYYAKRDQIRNEQWTIGPTGHLRAKR
jgi:hypothetical protein